MRVAFFGTPSFAVPTLDALIESGVDVSLVVTQPDRPRGRSHSTLTASPVKQRALAAGIPVLQPERPRGSEFLDALAAAQVDLAVVVAYGHILRPDVLAIPRLGMVNVHASLLPRWRGAAPIHWAILAGDDETGVSIMRMDAGLDSGPVWHAVTTPVGDADTTGVMFDRLARLGASAMIDTLPAIARGEVPVPQDEHSVTLAPKIDRVRARIDWTQGAMDISRLVRAMDPAPGAWTTIGDAEVKFFGSEVLRDLRFADEPGVIDPTSPGPLLVSTADGTLAVRDVQPAGRRRMSAADWLRGGGVDADARFA